MDGQISIFDFVEIPENEIEEMTSGELANVIGTAIGIEFKPTGWSDEYEAQVGKKVRLSVNKSHFACDGVNHKEGDAFISCGWSCGTSGAGSPIQSIQEAVEWFKKRIEKGET